MVIRPYREADREALHRITVDCFEQVSVHAIAERLFGRFRGTRWQARKTENIDADLLANPTGIFVAVEADQVLGFVTTRLEPATGIGYVPNIAVAPGHQGLGLGAALIRTALDYLAEHGMTHAKIETLVGNAAGEHLYPKMGFREIARQIHYMMELPRRE